jgi:hypothetical protein
MDSKGFRLKSEPDLVVQPSRSRTQQEVTRETDAQKTCAAPDNRFRAYAAPLEDGRLVTDYRQACTTRAPPGQQFATKQWIVQNTDEVIRISRERQVQDTGHALGTAPTEAPALTYQQCAPTGCEFFGSGHPYGIGLERTDKCPPLFGTFTFPPNPNTIARDREFTALNSRVEYGRNTPSRFAHLYQ